MGEDCLNLNVWAPEQQTGKALPVAVYLHGGGFEYGANTQITSNASGLAASGRVVGVSINYRLGALGAVSLSQYGGALAEAGNLCLQDVIAALTWIRQYIAYFGGDPDNVTVYGHSAGAYSTFGLLGASAADGLYRRLAGFSAGPSRLQPAWWAEELAHRFVTEPGVADNPEKLLGLDRASLVGMGTLRVGDKLPTAREVVAATAINPNTVLRAYRDMEQAGLVELRRGLGTFVTRSLARPGAENDSRLRQEVADWVARARAVGLERADVLALVTAALDAYDNEHDSTTPGTGNERRRTHDRA